MKITQLLLLLVSLFSYVIADEFREWSTIGGGSFEAKLNAVGTRTVELENREGKTIDFPLADLKPSDQEYARDWQVAQSQGGGATASAPPAELSEFGTKVHKELVVVDGDEFTTYKADSSGAPKYYAFYQSAMWCPPCRAFTPDLVRFYKRYKQKETPFELIFISHDKNLESMAEYMDEYRMPWPAFPYGKNKSIVSSQGRGIPNLIVTDANGKKLLDSYDDSGKYLGPNFVLEKFEDLLKAD